MLSCDALCILLHFVLAPVFLEILLGNPVEGERGNRTFEERSCHTPCAVRAAPAAEVVAVDPDQVFVHTSAFACVWIRAWARRGGRLQCSLARKVNSYSWVPENIFHEIATRPSN